MNSVKHSFVQLNLRFKIKDLLIVFGVLCCLVIPLAFVSHSLEFRLDTDYNVVIPMAHYAINAIRDPSNFLYWNSYVGLGIPVLGDPSSLLFSPYLLPLFLLFGADMGLRLSIVCTIFLSATTMWILLRSLQISSKISQWGSLLYATSGALAAMVASGHIEKFPSYAIAPILFLLLWKKPFQFANGGLTGILLTSLYFSDDFYAIWFFSLFWLVFRLYDIVSGKMGFADLCKEGICVFGSFFIFSSPKLILFFRDVWPYMNRLSYIDPFAGSIHAFFLPLQFVIPWQVPFYDDQLTLKRFIGFRYNWYEYYAFITPLVFIPLFWIKDVWKKPIVRYGVLAIVMASLYLAVMYPYSPFYWIFRYVPLTRTFRVPQRIAVPLLVPLIVMIAYCIESILKRFAKKRIFIVFGICGLSIIWTFAIAFSTIRSTFVPLRVTEKKIAAKLRAYDGGNYYVVNFSCCMQPFLLDQNIPILNYYYGWTPIYAPIFTNLKYGGYNFTTLRTIRPSYIIADVLHDFSVYTYYEVIREGGLRIWKTDNPTVLPTL